MTEDLPPDVAFFKVDVKEYNDIDEEISDLNNKIKPLNLRIKELKAKKSELQGNICEFMSKNKIDQCNVSGLDKVPTRKIVVDNPLSVGGLNNLPNLPAGSSGMKPFEDDAASVSTVSSSVKLIYKASKTVKPVNKDFVRTQCLRFFTEKSRLKEFKDLSDSDKGIYLFDFIYNTKEDREVVEKPMLKKITF